MKIRKISARTKQRTVLRAKRSLARQRFFRMRQMSLSDRYFGMDKLLDGVRTSVAHDCVRALWTKRAQSALAAFFAALDRPT